MNLKTRRKLAHKKLNSGLARLRMAVNSKPRQTGEGRAKKHPKIREHSNG